MLVAKYGAKQNKPIMIKNILLKLTNFIYLTEFFIVIVGIILAILLAILKNHKNPKIIYNIIFYRVAFFAFFLGFGLNYNFFVKIFTTHNIDNNSLLDSTIIYSYFFKSLTCIFASIFFYIKSKFREKQKIENEQLLLIYFSITCILFLFNCTNIVSSFFIIELICLSFYSIAVCNKKFNCSLVVVAGIKYFVMGSLSCAFFLTSYSLIYAFTGTFFKTDFQNHFFNSPMNETQFLYFLQKTNDSSLFYKNIYNVNNNSILATSSFKADNIIRINNKYYPFPRVDYTS